MVDHDMLFRSGLMLAVLLLAGIFGASIARRMTDEADGILEEISGELAAIVIAIHNSDPGSFSEVSFGESGSADGPLISFPSRISDRTYTIEILPGMVIIEYDSMKEIVLADDCIVPCYSPDDRLDFNKNLSRRSGKLSGGFRIETPNSLVMKVPKGAEEGEVFIYPASITNDRVLEVYTEIVDLIEGPSDLYPGWIRMVNVSVDRVRSLEPSMLLLSTISDHTLSGSCLIPVYLPSIIEIANVDLTDIGQIALYKKAVLGPDGIIEMKWGLTGDPDHILP